MVFFPAGKQNSMLLQLATNWPPRSTFQLTSLTQANRAKLRPSCQHFNIRMPRDPTLSEAKEGAPRQGPSHILCVVL